MTQLAVKKAVLSAARTFYLVFGIVIPAAFLVLLLALAVVGLATGHIH